MADQEILNEINAFDHEKELATVNLNRKIDLPNLIKEYSKFVAVSNAVLVSHSLPGKIYLFPKKNAITKGFSGGTAAAFTQATRLLQDAIKYDWTLDVLDKEFNKLIVTSKENFRIAQENYSEKNTKKIEQERFYAFQTYYLIIAWGMLFLDGQQS